MTINKGVSLTRVYAKISRSGQFLFARSVQCLFTRSVHCLFVAVAILLLSACTTNVGRYMPWANPNTGIVTNDPDSVPNIAWQTTNQRQTLSRASDDIAARPSLQTVDGAAPEVPVRKINAAILLPLTGKNAELGQAMLKSAQMALFDVGSAGFELEPHDTQSTKDGAVSAAQQAMASQPDIILGPIFADDLKAIKPLLSSTSIPVLSFTTDWTLAGGNIYVMGFMPFTQVARVVQYAQSKGSDRIAFFAPQTPYCDIVLDTLKKSGANIVINERYAPNQSDLSLQVQELVKRNKTEEGLSFDTLFLPVGGEGLKSLASVFELQGVRSGPVRFLGTGLWDDASINKDPSLYGGLYAAPDPRLRRDFEGRYQENYGIAPPRLASLAYDATALAAVLSHTGDRSEAPYSTAKLTNPRGFAGIDGIFRFRSDGLVDRGLAVLEVQSGQSKMVDPAPTAFIGSGS